MTRQNKESGMYASSVNTQISLVIRQYQSSNEFNSIALRAAKTKLYGVLTVLSAIGLKSI